LAQALVQAFRPSVGRIHPIEEISLVPSGSGAYEISVDGKLVYSKLKTGKHVSDADAIRLIRQAVDG